MQDSEATSPRLQPLCGRCGKHSTQLQFAAVAGNLIGYCQPCYLLHLIGEDLGSSELTTDERGVITASLYEIYTFIRTQTLGRVEGPQR